MRWIFVFCLLLGCSKGKEPPQEKKVPVRVGSLVVRDTAKYLLGHGTLSPIAKADIAAQVGGRITTIHCRTGQAIQKDDLLVEIDPLPYQLTLQAARGELAQKQIQKEFAQKKLQRYTSIQTEHFAPIELDHLEKELALHEADLVIQEARVKKAELDVAHCFLRAPISGIIGKIHAGEEQWLAAGDPFGIIRSTDQLYVDFAFSEAEISQVALGAIVEVKASGQETWEYSGPLLEIDNAIDPKSGTIRTRALIPNPKRTLRSGQFVEWRVKVAAKVGLHFLPTHAVQQKGTREHFVYVIKEGNIAEERAVELGEVEGEEISILSGLAADDCIVIRGQTRLYPGAKVEIVP